MNNNTTQGRLWYATYGEGKYRVEARGILIGNDLIVAIYGGTTPHIGALAIAIPRPSLQDPNITSATSSVFTLVGHKDDIIARREAEELASRLNRVVVVLAGVHIDQTTDMDIQRLVTTSSECVRLLLCQLLPEYRAKHSAACRNKGAGANPS